MTEGSYVTFFSIKVEGVINEAASSGLVIHAPILVTQFGGTQSSRTSLLLSKQKLPYSYSIPLNDFAFLSACSIQ